MPNNLANTQNINSQNPAYPNTGPVATGYNFLNPQMSQKGGNCNCGLFGGAKKKNKQGGMCPTCTMGYMVGGTHRIGCKCSSCKKMMKGGSGNNGIPYPNGLVGSPWTPSISGWPGVNGVNGDSNYLALNKYEPDVSRQMIDVGANPPFLGFTNKMGGKRSHKSKQKGGTLSNLMGQDLINLGRQFQFGLGSAYNALAGYPQPTNPMPWKGQIANTPSLNAVKSNLL
jgi:hypothetical protein